MTSDRPYRSAMSLEEALDEIGRCTGTQFDPDVADGLFKVKGTFSLDIITAGTRGQ
jgi:HD-GYP domain-containing protein (c-di-GMP phosphodiesterase class II)